LSAGVPTESIRTLEYENATRALSLADFDRRSDGEWFILFFFSGILNSTHYRPVMPFGSRKNYHRESFYFSIVKIKKISPLGKPEIK